MTWPRLPLTHDLGAQRVDITFDGEVRMLGAILGLLRPRSGRRARGPGPAGQPERNGYGSDVSGVATSADGSPSATVASAAHRNGAFRTGTLPDGNATIRNGVRRTGTAPKPTSQPTIPKAAVYLAALADAFGPVPPGVLAREPPLVGALVLDPTALARLARGDVAARAYLARAAGSLARVLVPATALLDPHLAAVADAVATIVPVDAALARAAGGLMLKTSLRLPFDALAVALAAREDSAAVLTADRAGVGAIARAADHPKLYVFAL